MTTDARARPLFEQRERADSCRRRTSVYDRCVPNGRFFPRCGHRRPRSAVVAVARSLPERYGGRRLLVRDRYFSRHTRVQMSFIETPAFKKKKIINMLLPRL